MGVPQELIVLISNLYSEEGATVRMACGAAEWFPIGKGVQRHILSPCDSNLYAEHAIRKAGLDLE